MQNYTRLFIKLSALRSIVLVLVAGVLASIGIAIAVEKYNSILIQRAMDDYVDQVADFARQRLNLYDGALRGVRGALMATGVDQMTLEGFRRYSLSRDISIEFPGARGFGYIRRVRPGEVNSFVNRVKSLGLANFNVFGKNEHDGDKFIIQYIEPMSVNYRGIGFDIASESSRYAAAIESMRQGRSVLSRPVALLSAPTSMPNAFLFLLPIYQNTFIPDNVDMRESDLVGWAFASVSMDKVLDGFDNGYPQGLIKLIDVENKANQIEFYNNKYALTRAEAAYSSSKAFQIYGRSWQINFQPSKEFISSVTVFPSYIIFFFMLLGTAVISALMWVWKTKNDNVLKLAKVQKELSAIFDASFDAIIGKTITGVVTTWNKGAERIFGYTAEEAIGRELRTLIIPEEFVHEEKMVLSTIAQGGAIPPFEAKRSKKNGDLVDLSITVSPIFSETGEVIGAFKIARDISHKKMEEARIVALNEQLEYLVRIRTKEIQNIQHVLRAVIDAIPSMIGYWDKNLTNKVSNNAYKAWVGLSPEQLQGRSLSRALGSDYYESNKEYIKHVLQGEEQKFEKDLVFMDGRIRHFLVHYIPDIVHDRVEGFYAIAHDITDQVESRTQLVSALRENEILLHNINNQLLYSATNAEGVIIDVNERFCEVQGYLRNELIGKSHKFLNSDVHPAEFWQEMWETILSGKMWRAEVCNKKRNGGLLWFDTVITPVLSEKNNVTGYMAFRIDITERKLADEKITHLNSMLSSVMQASSEVAVIATDLNGTITLFNVGAQRMLGYSDKEVVGVCTPGIFHVYSEVEERAKELSARYNCAINGFDVFVFVAEQIGFDRQEWTYVRKDGSYFTGSLVVTTMRDEAGVCIGHLGIATDITVQNEQRRELLAARDQLLMAAEAAHLGVWTWHLEDNSVTWNKQMFTLMDYPYSETDSNTVTYQHWRDRLLPDDIEATEQRLLSAVEGTGDFNTIFRIILSDGTVRHIKAGAIVEKNLYGKPWRVVGVNLDITDQKEFEQALLQSKEQAEEASVAKGQFLANMSHEIRTPMNAVLGMLELVSRTVLNDKQVDYIGKAQVAAKSLLGLLNDILDFSKIEAGKLELDVHLFSLQRLIEELAIVLSGNLGKKRVELMFDIDPTLPNMVWGDQLRMQQIVINLAGNAIKFTPQGEVVVSFTLLSSEPGTMLLRVAVKDSGVGISREQSTRIFEGFSQAESSTSRRFGGTGLGLSISKRLVELMGGQLKLESQLGKGSLFWFDIELKVEDTSPLLDRNTEEELSVLIVDDNELVGSIITRTLGSIGCNATYVSSGEDAIDLVVSNSHKGIFYHAIIMDWMMPEGMDGVETAQRIHQVCADTSPPIIMLSAFGGSEMSELLLSGDAPFVEYLSKPVTPWHLLDTIYIATGMKIKDHTAARSARQTNRLQDIRLLVVEDNPLNRQVAYELFSQEGAAVMLANDGRAGVELATSGEHEFDVIVMDMQMPDIDGIEATRRIRKHELGQTIPILAMTANVSKEDQERCMAAGMNGHVGKPIDIDYCVSVVLGLLGRSTSSNYLEHPRSAEDDGSLLEEKSAVVARLGNSEEIYASLLTGFAAECQRLFGLMDEQVQQQDGKALRDTLHALKGVSATLGAKRLAILSAHLEDQLRGGSADNHDYDDMARQLIDLYAVGGATLDALKVLSDSMGGTATVDSIDAEPGHPRELVQILPELFPLLEAGDMSVLEYVPELTLLSRLEHQDYLAGLVELIKGFDFDGATMMLKQIMGDDHAE